jgi:hypothetical protein
VEVALVLKGSELFLDNHDGIFCPSSEAASEQCEEEMKLPNEASTFPLFLWGLQCFPTPFARP